MQLKKAARDHQKQRLNCNFNFLSISIRSMIGWESVALEWARVFTFWVTDPFVDFDMPRKSRLRLAVESHDNPIHQTIFSTFILDYFPYWTRRLIPSMWIGVELQPPDWRYLIAPWNPLNEKGQYQTMNSIDMPSTSTLLEALITHRPRKFRSISHFVSIFITVDIFLNSFFCE